MTMFWIFAFSLLITAYIVGFIKLSLWLEGEIDTGGKFSHWPLLVRYGALLSVQMCFGAASIGILTISKDLG